MADLSSDVVEQLALQSDQQRCIDAAHRDLAATQSALDDAATLGAEVLQPLVEEAANANREMPLLREELSKAADERTKTLMQLRLAQVTTCHPTPAPC